ncbi:MAG: sigma-70 family RNA polymerase sigma factor [Thermoanaerobaculia bacterium]
MLPSREPADLDAITGLLRAWSRGDPRAPGELMALVYDRLHRQARGFMARERPGHTLQPTALVHEAYLRLVDQQQVRCYDRGHFYALAATAMRRVLLNHARARCAAKRRGGRPVGPMGERLPKSAGRAAELIAMDEALARLAEIDPRQARIVELRFFAGLTVEEAARALGVSAVTVKRGWRLARAWLQRELRTTGGADG